MTQYTREQLLSLPKEQLVDIIMKHQRPPATAQRPTPYDLSMAVLVIDGGEVTTAQLSAVLNKSYLRDDQREADTPLMFRPSISRQWSADPADFEGRNYSMARDRETSPDCSPMVELQSPGASPDRVTLAGRPRPLTLAGSALVGRPQSLDSDAIVSMHTLRLFNAQYGADGRDAMSPSVGGSHNSIYVYLLHKFSADLRHEPNIRDGLGQALLTLFRDAERIFAAEPRHVCVESPCYVFGDIHGNFGDLSYFMKTLIPFGSLHYTPHRFLFLGDYVDRGDFSVEVVALLFAMKALQPQKTILLRGNHEDALVSGDLNSYGASSFRAQCRELFGGLLGDQLWKAASAAFAQLPLTANIDGRIFCTHGGLPRYAGGVDNRLEQLSRPDFPRLESLFAPPPNENPEQAKLRQIATDTCWSDPAEDESALDAHGFGPNPRGSGVILFGSRAVDEFLARYGFDVIFRAHQEKSDGLKLSKSARVFTIFSTSAYVGHSNGAGVVMVADGKMRLIIKNPEP